ncbi:MAG: hypothetical protein JSS04_06350 [Proteobacteria bacterium]|nr:hypothetical protein [Pseudomonadota bacterium]
MVKNRVPLMAAAGILSASMIHFATAQSVPKQCYMLVGGDTANPGTALVEFTDPAQVHLYFRHSMQPYQDMRSGKGFANVAASMIDQRLRPITRNGAEMKFDNGENAVYTITVNGGMLGGNITNPQGKKFGAQGYCT